LLFVAGCSSGIYPVEGKVVWQDGSPATELAGSHVIFDLPDQQTGARGYVQPDGSFRLTTKSPNDGALPGDYRVMLVEVGRKPIGGPESGRLAPGAMDSRYSDPSTTDLKVTVEPRPNKLTLTVQRAGKGR
jgi:hypothetical protein